MEDETEVPARLLGLLGLGESVGSKGREPFALNEVRAPHFFFEKRHNMCEGDFIKGKNIFCNIIRG